MKQTLFANMYSTLTIAQLNNLPYGNQWIWQNSLLNQLPSCERKAIQPYHLSRRQLFFIIIGPTHSHSPQWYCPCFCFFFSFLANMNETSSHRNKDAPSSNHKKLKGKRKKLMDVKFAVPNIFKPN